MSLKKSLDELTNRICKTTLFTGKSKFKEELKKKVFKQDFSLNKIIYLANSVISNNEYLLAEIKKESDNLYSLSNSSGFKNLAKNEKVEIVTSRFYELVLKINDFLVNLVDSNELVKAKQVLGVLKTLFFELNQTKLLSIIDNIDTNILLVLNTKKRSVEYLKGLDSVSALAHSNHIFEAIKYHSGELKEDLIIYYAKVQIFGLKKLVSLEEGEEVSFTTEDYADISFKKIKGELVGHIKLSGFFKKLNFSFKEN